MSARATRFLRGTLVLALVAGAFATPTRAAAQATAPQPAPERWRTLEEEGLPPLRYALLLPPGFDAARSWPVLVALPPGSGSEELVEQGLALYFEAPARERGWVVVSPAAPGGESFAGAGAARLPALLDAVAREVRAEGGGVHLAGVSNGGRGAFHAAGLWPERFLSLCVLPGAAADGDRARLAQVARLPVLLCVGERDASWLEATAQAYEELRALGAGDVQVEVRTGEEHRLDPSVATLVFDRLDALRAAARGAGARRFLEGTRQQFAPEVHAGRRARLARRLEAAGGGVLLAPSREGTSRGETFRQADGFLHLTGLELPRSILALESDGARATVFAPARDARFESSSRPNDFPGRLLADDPDLARASGLDALLPSASLEAALARWVEEGRTLWLDAGGAGLAEAEPPAPFALRDEARALELWLRARFPAARLADAFPELARLRMVKGPEEVERIRRACAVTAQGIRAAARAIRPGVDERTLEGVLEAAFKAGGAQRPAFDSIVKSGPNALWPWRILAASYDRRNRTLAAGELVVFDVGCELDHYASDVGRTFPVSGRFTPEQARRLRLVTSVSDAILAQVRPGVTLGELRAVAEAAIPPDERRCMQTGSFFGHHVGLDVGDASLFEEPLAAGMVFTVEPWYYDHEGGVAVFVEDVVLVTEDGCEILTAELPRDVPELEALVAQR